MEAPQNQFMFSKELNLGDKLVLIGDAVRSGANGFAMYYEGHDFDKGKDFARVAWRDSDGTLPYDWHKKILHAYEPQHVRVTSMQLDVAVEVIAEDLIKD